MDVGGVSRPEAKAIEGASREPPVPGVIFDGLGDVRVRFGEAHELEADGVDHDAPRATSAGELGEQNLGDLGAQPRGVISRRLPHDRPVNPEVLVHQEVPKRDDVCPRDLRMALL
jgi:hypothetical protein